MIHAWTCDFASQSEANRLLFRQYKRKIDRRQHIGIFLAVADWLATIGHHIPTFRTGALIRVNQLHTNVAPQRDVRRDLVIEIASNVSRDHLFSDTP